MTAPGVLFAMIGIKAIIMIGLAVLTLYGRGGSRLLRSTRYGRAVDPWLDLVRVAPRPQEKQPVTPPPSKRGQGRVFWALALTAAAIAAAWVATRIVVLNGTGNPH